MKWKKRYFSKNIIIKTINIILKKKINYFFFLKNSYFCKVFLKKKIFIYNGVCFKKLKILFFFYGFNLGSFIFTKKPFKYNKKIKKNKTKR
jgi:ribosomal protein S19